MDFRPLDDRLRDMHFLAHVLKVSFAALALVMTLPAFAEQELTRLERTNLLSYHRHGEVVQGKSLGDWKKRRVEILDGMRQVMGPLPGKEKRCALDVKIDQEVDCGTYV